MDIVVLGENRQPVTIDKFVVTTFIDVPRLGLCTTFIEICTASRQPFQLIVPCTESPQSQPELYLDFTSCERLFSGYTLLDRETGAHKQRAGELLLQVHPTAVEITPVTTQIPASPTKAFHVAFPNVQQGNICLGTWLSWCQTTPYSASRQSSRFIFQFHTDYLKIEVFYAFIVLPSAFRPLDSVCEFLPSQSPLSTASEHNPVHEFELDAQFPIFPAWQPLIYGRKILRNRDPLMMVAGGYVSISFRADSPLYTRKITTLAYCAGVSVALSASFLANSLFALQQHGQNTFTIGALLISTALLTLSMYIGYRALKK